MPELPEVEAARRAIEEHCLGKKIRRAVVAADSKVVEGVVPSEFEAALVGKTILATLRKGKNLWLRLDSPPFPSFQFGMTGAFHIKGVAVTKYKRSAVNSEDEWPSKYSKVFLELDDGLELSFTDKRRFARVRLLQDPGSMPPISELGPDALLEPMKLEKFVESLSSKKTSIKALLLDQSFISGIGNWVADEVLYHARIHPLQTAASLTREKCGMLHKCIKQVLEKALEVGAESSQFPSNWIFHSREKKPGKAFVVGKKIEFLTAGGRTTAYVPELQKIDGATSGKASGSKSRKPRSVRPPGDDLELDSGEEEGSENKRNHLKSKSKKGRGTSGTTRKRPATRTRVSPEDNEGLGTEEDREREESDSEVKVYTRKPKSRKVANTNGAAKKPPAKKGTSLNPDEEEGQKKSTVKGATKEQRKMRGQSSKPQTEADQAVMQRAKKRRK